MRICSRDDRASRMTFWTLIEAFSQLNSSSALFKTVLNEFDCDSEATELLWLVETILTTSSTDKVLFRAAILFTFWRITADLSELVCGRPLAGFSNVLTRRESFVIRKKSRARHKKALLLVSLPNLLLCFMHTT